MYPIIRTIMKTEYMISHVYSVYLCFIDELQGISHAFSCGVLLSLVSLVPKTSSVVLLETTSVTSYPSQHMGESQSSLHPPNVFSHQGLNCQAIIELTIIFTQKRNHARLVYDMAHFLDTDGFNFMLRFGSTVTILLTQ